MNASNSTASAGTTAGDSDASSDASTGTRPRKQEAVWPFAASVLAAAIALFVYSALPDPPQWLNRTIIVFVGALPSNSHAIHLGIGLLILARGLKLRRLIALYITAAAIVWSAGMSLLTWDQPWRLIPMAAFTISFYGARDRFPALPDPDRLRGAVQVGFGLVLTGAILGGGGLFLQRGRLNGSLTPSDAGRQVFDGLTANTAPLTMDGHGWFMHALSLLGGITLFVVLSCALAPARAPLPGTDEERSRVRKLVQHPDSDTLAPFALRYDKSYVFSADGRAAIGYRVFLGTAIAGGDPIGAAESREAAIAAFIDLCAVRGWRPSVLAARAELLPLWRRHGLRGIGIGDEVVISVPSFSLTGRQIRGVRQAVARTERQGITTRVIRETLLDETLADQLLHIHQRWLKGKAEHGFAMNLDAITAGRHPEALVIAAFDASGTAVGFQRYHPVGAAHGTATALSLDVMPRDPTAPNGVNERLITDIIEYCRAQGIEKLSLNFAAFRTLLDAGTRRTIPERVGYRTLHLLDPWIMLESLYRFNAKFQPGWQPRSVLFRSWGEVGWLAAAALAMEFSLPLDRRRVAPAGDRLRDGVIEGVGRPTG